MPDLRNLGLPEHILGYFRVSFHDLLFKNQAAAVTLRMMSNNHRSALVINDHLPIEEGSRKYSPDHSKLVKIEAIIQQVTSRLISPSVVD